MATVIQATFGRAGQHTSWLFTVYFEGREQPQVLVQAGRCQAHAFERLIDALSMGCMPIVRRIECKPLADGNAAVCAAFADAAAATPDADAAAADAALAALSARAEVAP